MQGYDVVTHDDEKVVGHVVDKVDGNYIVEQGHLRKTKHALPEQFATVDEAGERLVLTVTKDVLSDSPKVNGDVDEDAVAPTTGSRTRRSTARPASTTTTHPRADRRPRGGRADGRHPRVAGAARETASTTRSPSAGAREPEP